VGRGFGSARCGEIRQSVASYSRAARGSAKTGAFDSLALRASCGVDAEKRRTQRAWRCARKSASVDASSREDGTHPPRTALAVETRRVARLFAASMSMPSNPSVAFSYAGPPSRIIVAPRHAPAGQKMPTLGRSVPRKFPRPPGETAGVSVLPRQTRSLRHPRSGTSTRAACPRNAARRDHEPRDARSKPRRRGDRRAPARCRAPRVRRDGAPGGWPRLQSLGRVGSPRHAVRGVRVRGGQDRQRAGRHPRRLAGRARARRGTQARVSASPHPVVHAFGSLAQAPIRSSSRSKISPSVSLFARGRRKETSNSSRFLPHTSTVAVENSV
jgi:hypothetical protein